MCKDPMIITHQVLMFMHALTKYGAGHVLPKKCIGLKKSYTIVLLLILKSKKLWCSIT